MPGLGDTTCEVVTQMGSLLEQASGNFIRDARQVVIRICGLRGLPFTAAGHRHSEVNLANPAARHLFRNPVRCCDPASFRLIPDTVQRSAAGRTAGQWRCAHPDFQEFHRVVAAREAAGSFRGTCHRHRGGDLSAQSSGRCAGREPGTCGRRRPACRTCPPLTVRPPIAYTGAAVARQARASETG